MNSLNSTITEEKAARISALVCFRKPSTLDEFLHHGLMVQRVLAGKIPDRKRAR
jgi:hypothetical protein